MTKEIALSKGKTALVSDEDYPALSQHKWYAKWDGYNWYAARDLKRSGGKRVTLRMHQVVCGKGADHIDGNGLNNQRENLRMATHQQNMLNRGSHRDKPSQYKGVTWHEQMQKWCTRITLEGKNRYIGLFSNEVDAARAYDGVAREYRGEFSRLNFPDQMDNEQVEFVKAKFAQRRIDFLAHLDAIAAKGGNA